MTANIREWWFFFNCEPVQKFRIQKIFAIAMLEILVDCSAASNQYTSYLMQPNGIVNHMSTTRLV